MVDYLLVKRNNHIFVVVYQGTVRPCRDCSWCKKYKLPGTHVAELKLCEVSVSLFLAIHFYQKLIRGWNVQLSFNTREYSHLPSLETLVTDVHFQQMAGEDKTWTRGPWTSSLDRVHGPLSWTRSMDPLSWTGSMDSFFIFIRRFCTRTLKNWNSVKKRFDETLSTNAHNWSQIFSCAHMTYTLLAHVQSQDC